jgi:hypothetical protein
MKKILLIAAWLLVTCCYFNAKSACDGTGGYTGTSCMTDRDCKPGKRCVAVQDPTTRGWYTKCEKCPNT